MKSNILKKTRHRIKRGQRVGREMQKKRFEALGGAGEGGRPVSYPLVISRGREGSGGESFTIPLLVHRRAIHI